IGRAGRGRRLSDVGPARWIAQIPRRDGKGGRVGAFWPLRKGSTRSKRNTHIEIEKPQSVRRVAKGDGNRVDENVGRSGWRSDESIEVGGEHPEDSLGVLFGAMAGGGAQVEVDEAGGGVADQHLAAIESEDPAAIEVPAEKKLVGCHVVGIRPGA